MYCYNNCNHQEQNPDINILQTEDACCQYGYPHKSHRHDFNFQWNTFSFAVVLDVSAKPFVTQQPVIESFGTFGKTGSSEQQEWDSGEDRKKHAQDSQTNSDKSNNNQEWFQ